MMIGVRTIALIWSSDAKMDTIVVARSSNTRRGTIAVTQFPDAKSALLQ